MDEKSEVHVKGSALTSTRKFVSAKYGDLGWDRVLSALPEGDRELLSKRVLVSNWYPFSSFINLLSTADKLLGTGDMALCTDMGRFSAENDLSSIYMVFNKEANPHLIISRAASIWKTYYDSGSMEIGERGDNSVAVRIVDFAEPAKPHCRRVQGWIEMALSLAGGVEPKVAETKCRCAGDEFCEFICSWK